MRLTRPRIPLVQDDTASAAQAEVLKPSGARGPVLNVFRTLAQEPDAAKAFVNQLTRVAALEGRAHGLRAYAVEPGVVETSMQQALREASAWQLPGRDRFVALHQDGELRPPDEVGEALVALIAADGGRDDVVFRLS